VSGEKIRETFWMQVQGFKSLFFSRMKQKIGVCYDDRKSSDFQIDLMKETANIFQFEDMFAIKNVKIKFKNKDQNVYYTHYT